MTTVCPELLAAKICSLRNLEDPEVAKKIEDQPRILEALWFIQHESHGPGGVKALAQKVRQKSPERFATRAMQASGPPSAKGKWTLEECFPVWQSTSGGWDRRWGRAYCEWRDRAIDSCDTVEAFSGRGELAKHGLQFYNYDFFKHRCDLAAEEDLPGRLIQLCQPGAGLSEPWYCPDLFAVLFQFMDAHAAAAEQTIASTQVKQTIFRELEFSMSERVPVIIVGDSRFGKTKSVATKCQMWPGRARLIQVPSENRQKDFLLAHADALHYTPKRNVSAAVLDRALQFILKQSGLFLLYDEAQWLIPSTYSTGTKPTRLNWIRTHIIDADKAAGCALFATEQSYQKDFARFVAKARFAAEQWLGRVTVVELPEDICRDDLLSVARINFPDISLPLLKLIAARAQQSEGLLHHIELTAKRARFIARELGRSTPQREDIEAAIRDMLPRSERHAVAPQEPASRTPIAEPSTHRCSDAAASLPQSKRSSSPAQDDHALTRISAAGLPAMAGS